MLRLLIHMQTLQSIAVWLHSNFVTVTSLTRVTTFLNVKLKPARLTLHIFDITLHYFRKSVSYSLILLICNHFAKPTVTLCLLFIGFQSLSFPFLPAAA